MSLINKLGDAFLARLVPANSAKAGEYCEPRYSCKMVDRCNRECCQVYSDCTRKCTYTFVC